MRRVAFLAGTLTLITFLGVWMELSGDRVAAPAEDAASGGGISSDFSMPHRSTVVGVVDAGHTDRSRDTALASETVSRCATSQQNDTTSETSEHCPYPKLSDEQREAVAWGRSRFLAAGLVPPRVRFVFHDDTERCRLRRGLFNPDTRTIEICDLNRETLIHELAHAWVDSNVSEAARAEFTRHRGLEVWNDHSVPWAGRATEHAAEIVAWGVEEESRLISWIEPDGSHVLRLLTIPDSTPEELAAAFQMLTGIPSHPDRTKSQATLKPAFSPEAGRLQHSPTG
jgi:hypothetical protein